MENETRDWETNPHLYLQNEDGNFVLKKDGYIRRATSTIPFGYELDTLTNHLKPIEEHSMLYK